MDLSDDASTDSEPLDCQYCSMIRVCHTEDEKGRPINHAALFHDECLDCQPYISPKNDLCPFCKHLRLQHFLCYYNGGNGARPAIEVSFGGQENLPLIGVGPSDSPDDLTRDCSLCQLVRNDTAMRRRLLGIDSDEEHIPERGPLEIKYLSNDAPYSLSIVCYQPRQACDLRPYAPQDAPSLLQRTASWDRISRWLDECVSTHPKCESHSTRAPTYFRLIDVRRKRLTVGNIRYRFAALSYVWGQNPNPSKLKAELSNIELLERDGGVDTSMLPATIADAFEVCRQLDIDYLWVDRLCIVQDDNENKQQHFDEMARIYAAAHVVIVVTEGDMDAGIPGIRPRLPGIQRQHEIDGVVFINEIPGFIPLAFHSEWDNRAWTYQESVFSRRRLYFTPAQVFFECDEWTCHEDHTAENYRGSADRVSRDDRMRDFDTWTEHLEAYTRRILSHSSDIYNAFAGIQHTFIGDTDAFFCGLPRGNFNEALLWTIRESDGGEKRADCGLVPLPSWSWSSMEGTTRLSLSDYFVGTLVAWEYQKGSIFCPVQDHTAQRQKLLIPDPDDYYGRLFESPDAESTITLCMYSPTKTRQMVYKVNDRRNAPIILAIAWSHGCLETPWPFSNFKDCTFFDLAAELEFHWDSYQDLEREAVHNRPFGAFGDKRESFDLWPETRARAGLREGTLRGRVQSSFFQFKPTDKDWEIYILILDADGIPSGHLHTHLEEARALNLLSPESPKEELIALSLGCVPSRGSDTNDCIRPRAGSKDMLDKIWCFSYLNLKDNESYYKEVEQVCTALGPDGLDLSFVDADGSALMSIPIVYVMLIRWNGPVAHRVAVGWVLLTRWVKSNPQFKTVYLA